jgi:integrase
MIQHSKQRRVERLSVPRHCRGAGRGATAVALLDLSPAGARIEHGEPLPDWSGYPMDLPRALGGGRVRAQVVWSRVPGHQPGVEGNPKSVLRGICRRAVSLGLLPVNPVERIEGRLGRQDKEIRQADFLTAEELGKMLAAAERVCPREYPILLVMATVGLRIGEAAGLQIGDLDVPRLRLHIRRTVRRGYVGSPKSGKGGVVDVPTSTMAVLANIREIRQVEAAVDGKEPRWLFPGDTKEMPITPEAVGLALRKALAAAGIWKIRPHDLRHTYATLAIQAGVPLLTVSRQLRHASISTTADLYTHAVPGSDRAAAEALEAVLNRNQTLPPRNLTA